MKGEAGSDGNNDINYLIDCFKNSSCLCFTSELVMSCHLFLVNVFLETNWFLGHFFFVLLWSNNLYLFTASVICDVIIVICSYASFTYFVCFCVCVWFQRQDYIRHMWMIYKCICQTYSWTRTELQQYLHTITWLFFLKCLWSKSVQQKSIMSCVSVREQLATNVACLGYCRTLLVFREEI